MATEPFLTIDDLIQKTRELLSGLSRLGEYKHPLSVRKGTVIRGGREVKPMADSEASKTVRAGNRTYFLDLRRTLDSEPYLMITESARKSEGKDRERSTLTVFPEHAQAFLEALEEMVRKLQ